MNELQLTEMVLLMIGGWFLLTFAFRDIFLTARACFSGNGQKVSGLFFQTSEIWLLRVILSLVKSSRRREVLQKKFHVLIPLLQFVVWQTALLCGFSLLYLAIHWQTHGERTGDFFIDDFLSAFVLSAGVMMRFVQNAPALENPLIFLVANIQFYTGFLFYAFVCFYLLTLRRVNRRLKPILFNLNAGEGDFRSAFAAMEKLRGFYGETNLIVIMQKWEDWSREVENLLARHPHLIYSAVKRDFRVSWLAGLNVILDTTAAVIVAGKGNVERQARKTFGAARRALVSIHDRLSAAEKSDKNASFEMEKREIARGVHDVEILAAKMHGEDEGRRMAASEMELFEVWRYTYRSRLRELSEQLEAEISA